MMIMMNFEARESTNLNGKFEIEKLNFEFFLSSVVLFSSRFSIYIDDDDDVDGRKNEIERNEITRLITERTTQQQPKPTNIIII